MGQGWFPPLGRNVDRSRGAMVTVSELVDRYGAFYDDNGERLLTHRSLLRVARNIQRAKRNGTLIMPGDRRNGGTATAPHGGPLGETFRQLTGYTKA